MTYRDYLLDSTVTVAKAMTEAAQMALRMDSEEIAILHLEHAHQSALALLPIRPDPSTVTGIRFCECEDGGHNLGIGVCMCGGVLRS